MSDPFEAGPRRFRGLAYQSRLTGRFVMGLLILSLGVVFMLDKLGIVDADFVLGFWGALPLTYGIMRLTGFLSRRNFMVGSLFTLIGAWMLLENLNVVHYSVWDLWPIGLILFGFAMVGGALRRVRLAHEVESGGPASTVERLRDVRDSWTGRHALTSEDPSSTVSAFAMWSGIDRKMTTSDFRGGDVTAIMGGHEIDLRNAKIANGPAVLDLLVLMGGVDLRIPEDWKVSFEGLAIMGGVEDHSRPPINGERGHLILRGLVMMGGVEIKN